MNFVSVAIHGIGLIHDGTAVPITHTNGHSAVTIILAAAGIVLAVGGMARPPLIPEMLWRFIAWAGAVELLLWAAAHSGRMPSDFVWGVASLAGPLILGTLFWLEHQHSWTPQAEPRFDKSTEFAKPSLAKRRLRLRSEIDLGPALELAEDLRSAALLVRTELLDIRNKVEMLGINPILSDSFAFPTSEWNENRKTFARFPDLYDIVTDAYTKAHRVNEIWRWRRTQATTRLIAANLQQDGLDAVDGAAEMAVAALDQITGRESAQ
jgi:hypothetical protein